MGHSSPFTLKNMPGNRKHTFTIITYCTYVITVSSRISIASAPLCRTRLHIRPLGAGKTFGCFTAKTDYFSPKTHDKKAREHEKPNVKTSPAKRGTGYGYPAVGLDKYPEYKGDKYDGPQQEARVRSISTQDPDNEAIYDVKTRYLYLVLGSSQNSKDQNSKYHNSKSQLFINS